MLKRKTKIVATIGRPPDAYKRGIFDLDYRQKLPQDIDYRFLISGFLDHGVNVIRLNMAHIHKQENVGEFFKALRAVIKQRRPKSCNTAVLADLEGTKIRFSTPNKEALRADFGTEIRIELAHMPVNPGDAPVVLVGRQPFAKAYPREVEKIAEAFLHQAQVFVGDGEVVLEAAETQQVKDISETKRLRCRVVKPGLIADHAGFTLRGTKGDVDLDIPTYTDEDKIKLAWLLEEGFKKGHDDRLLAFIGLSFAQTMDDILRLKYDIILKLKELGVIPRSKAKPELDPQPVHAVDEDLCPLVVAKIETNKGQLNIESILKAADALMVARGDLGVQLSPEKVPAIQRRIIRTCRHLGKPVITATQMLKSMTDSFEPTRAEVNDVFQAILEGSDAVMLSEETSSGQYPLHAVKKMHEIAQRAEDYLRNSGLSAELSRTDACLGACRRHEGFLREMPEHSDLRKGLENARHDAVKNANRARNTGQIGKAKFYGWMSSHYDHEYELWLEQAVTDRISQAACLIAEQENAEGGNDGEDYCVIMTATTTGRTARMIARFRPTIAVIGATHDILNARKLALSYGILPVSIGHEPSAANPVDMFERASALVLEEEILDPRSMVVFVSGTHPERPGTTNTIQLRLLGDAKTRSTREIASGSEPELSVNLSGCGMTLAQRRAWSRNMRAFEKVRQQSIRDRTNLGRFVAIAGGDLAGYGEDDVVLLKSVSAQFPGKQLYIGRIEEVVRPKRLPPENKEKACQ